MVSDTIGTAHAFTTRWGGVSGGIWESLNLGENRGDVKADVEENYRRLSAAIGTRLGFAFTRQVHRTAVRRVYESDRREPYGPTPPECDGLITDVPGLPIIIFTADCIPILLYDRVKNAVGACHAGWRGTVADIAGETVRRMAEEFGSRPQDICAAIGPGIGACCFETGPEVPEAVRSLLGGEGDAFISQGRGGREHVDLKGVNRQLLIRAGLSPKGIDVSGECTMCLHDKYWSHRYTDGARGSQASIIMVKGC